MSHLYRHRLQYTNCTYIPAGPFIDVILENDIAATEKTAKAQRTAVQSKRHKQKRFHQAHHPTNISPVLLGLLKKKE